MVESFRFGLKLTISLNCCWELRLLVNKLLLFKYTPAYKFESDSIYQLVFNNPTSKTLVVNIVSDINQNYMKNQKSISIPKLGLRIVEISNFDGTLSFISKLPTCRAIVFKNPSLSKSNFDVFHS